MGKAVGFIYSYVAVLLPSEAPIVSIRAGNYYEPPHTNVNNYVLDGNFRVSSA